MEEDIKILKSIIRPTLCTGFERQTKILKAIENTLNRLEQDERVIKEMAEFIEYFSSDAEKDLIYAELHNCNECSRDWRRGKEAEIKDILEYFRKKCE